MLELKENESNQIALYYGYPMATYGRTTSDITEDDVINYLKNYIEPTTHKDWKYTKEESIRLGVEDAIRGYFGTLPTTPQPVSESVKDTLVFNSLQYARTYYMEYTEVPDWEW